MFVINFTLMIGHDDFLDKLPSDLTSELSDIHQMIAVYFYEKFGIDESLITASGYEIDLEDFDPQDLAGLG